MKEIAVLYGVRNRAIALIYRKLLCEAVHFYLIFRSHLVSALTFP